MNKHNTNLIFNLHSLKKAGLSLPQKDIMGIYQLIGWVGAFLFIIAYFLLATGQLSSEKGTYHTMNALGGFCLVVNAVSLSDMPTIVVNTVWGGIALFALFRVSKKGKAT